MNAVVRRSPNSCRELNPGRPTLSLVTILTELPRLVSLTHQVLKVCFSTAGEERNLYVCVAEHIFKEK
jgi:hypothetical protein